VFQVPHPERKREAGEHHSRFDQERFPRPQIGPDEIDGVVLDAGALDPGISVKSNRKVIGRRIRPLICLSPADRRRQIETPAPCCLKASFSPSDFSAILIS